MLEGFSESYRIAFFGMIASVIASFITFMGVLVTNWTTVYVARINKEQNEIEKHRRNIILPDTQSATATQTKVKFQIKPLWIFVVLATGLLLTIIMFLSFEHKRQQELEKHEFKSPDFYADKGNQYADVENYARAEAMYRQALIIDDTDVQIHNKLAVAL